MGLEFSWQIFEKYLNVKFYENPSSRSRVVPYWRTAYIQIDITKLRGLSPHANYNDRAAAAGRRS